METKKFYDYLNDDLSYILNSCKNEFNEMSGSGLLITGGAGFLGYYFIQSILKWNELNNEDKKIELYVLDNFVRGMPSWLIDLQANNDFVIINQSILDPLPNNFKNIDYIIHAASIASPIFYRKNPIATMDANVNGLRNILDFCLSFNNKVKGILYFSTSEIYGDPSEDQIPTKETYRGNVSCTGPRACYDESKRYGETMCVNFSQQHNLPIKIARPFNNYGPGLKITDGRALPDFARNIVEKKDIILLSDGSPTRTFCYVSDAIIGYFKILVIGRSGESYNIGTETPEISILELAKKCIDIGKEVFDYEVGLNFLESSDKDYLVDNPNRRCPDISKARKELSYKPSIGIEEGLLKSFHWYKSNHAVGEE
ncbi:NAD-dependent epimerase/dehydratase family protein [Gammaproteobacteria bacterium]|nr:NAD-dependent epimerase/dehydratase family protein [Gammaproteobacteria bacterium]MDA9039478.1 NAD-dependent epimerase/dehydratase family protein [Gammaproteobacteria bacterium]